jgi:hypothetical protein
MDPESSPANEADQTARAETASRPAQGWQDALGLAGPAFWDAILPVESARSARYERPATVVLVEVVGDPDGQTPGTEAGDVGDAIDSVARVLRASCRTSDHVARLDTARFGLILTETDEVAAINFIERAREGCERELRATGGRRVVFGWAHATGPTTLLAAADMAQERLRAERDD